MCIYYFLHSQIATPVCLILVMSMLTVPDSVCPMGTLLVFVGLNTPEMDSHAVVCWLMCIIENPTIHWSVIDAVPDPCLGSPCDPNADCARDGLLMNTFNCSCIDPYEGDGFSCICKLIGTLTRKAILNAYMNKSTYVCKLAVSTHDCIMNYGTCR